MESLTKKQRRLFYAFTLTPFIVFSLSLFALGLSLINQLLFMLAWVWPLCLETPGLAQYVESAKYRYSFLRLTYHTYRLFPSIWGGLLARNSVGLIFILGIGFYVPQTNLLFALGGTLGFEVCFAIYKRALNSPKNSSKLLERKK